MISLSTIDFDVNGHIVLDAQVDGLYQATRRGSVTATLDGGSVVYDTGFSVSDITLSVLVKDASREAARKIQYMIALHPVLIMSVETGVYRVRASSSTDGADINLQIRLLSRMDE
jgi:hypothetical protein